MPRVNLRRLVTSILDYAFDELGFERVFTGVFDFNPSSMRIIAKI